MALSYTKVLVRNSQEQNNTFLGSGSHEAAMLNAESRHCRQALVAGTGSLEKAGMWLDTFS